MVSFETSMQIIKGSEEIIHFGHFVYRVYTACVGGIELPVLIDGRVRVEDGAFLEVPSAVFAFYETGERRYFCLRVVKYQVVQACDFKPRAQLDIQVVGRLMKSRKSQLRKVTACRLDYICCSLLVQNEDRNKAAMQLVAFQKAALGVDGLPTRSLIEVKGKLANRKYAGGFEINLGEIVRVREENAVLSRRQDGEKGGK